MAPLTESILYHLHPGLSTLTWSSLNIDAYLHQVGSKIAHALVIAVGEKMQKFAIYSQQFFKLLAATETTFTMYRYSFDPLQSCYGSKGFTQLHPEQNYSMDRRNKRVTD